MSYNPDLSRLVIDCDPGQDDAIALLMAAGTPRVRSALEFVSTVAGNSPGDVTHRNARRVLDSLSPHVSPDLPVHRGAVTSLTHRVRSYFEGGDDLPGWLDETTPQPRPTGRAVDALLQASRKHGALTICALGPLTNIALAILTDPDFAVGVQSIVWMGGSIGRGNFTPAAEFNAYADPEAIAVVIDAGVDLVVVPAEIGETARVDDAAIDKIASLGTSAGNAAANLLREMGNTTDQSHYQTRGRPMYDPTAIAVLARPDIFTIEQTSLVVDTNHDGPSYGATHFDIDGRTNLPPNCRLVRSVDTVAFVEYTIKALAA